MPANLSAKGRTWQVGTLTYSFGGLAVLFAWLLWGDIAWSLRDRAIPTVMTLLFKKFGASDMVLGLLFVSLPSAIGLFTGPVVAFKSDRLRTRWGRRIPFLLFSTPVITLSMLGLAFGPQIGGALHHALGSHSPGLAPSVLIVLGVFWTLFELSLIINAAVFGGLANDVVPPPVLGRFTGLMRMGSLLVAMIFFSWWMGSVETYYFQIFLVVALIYGGGFMLMSFNVKEGTYPPPPETEGPQNVFSGVKSYFKDGFGNPYYLIFFGATIFAGLATGPFNIYSLYYAKSLQMDMGTYGKCLALTYFISFGLSYLLGLLVDRYHQLRMSMVVIACYGAVMAASFLFVRSTQLFAVALVAHGVLAGSYNTVSSSLNQRLLPRAKFAEISSAGGVLYSIINIPMAPVMGMFLDHENHDYRYTFLLGFIFTALSLVGFCILHRRFMDLGGPEHYVAPE